LLSIKDVYAGYGEIEIIHGISLEVKKGEIVSIVGPNGSGKSTLLKSIFSLVDIMGGEINYLDSNLSSVNTDQMIKKGLSFVPQTDNVFPTLTVEENIEFGIVDANIKDKKTISKKIMNQTNTIEFSKKYPNQLSGGQAKRVSLARALAANPKYILLDEPLVNLDNKAKFELLNLLIEVKENSDAGFIYVSHQKEEIDYLDSSLWILKNGKLVKDE